MTLLNYRWNILKYILSIWNSQIFGASSNEVHGWEFELFYLYIILEDNNQILCAKEEKSPNQVTTFIYKGLFKWWKRQLIWPTQATKIK